MRNFNGWALAALVGACAPSFADGMAMDVGGWPKIGFETEVNLEYDVFKGDRERIGSALNLQAEHQTLLEFDDNWSISNLLTLEPGEDPESGKTKFLENHELFVEELFGRWNNQLVNVRFGKFAQNFARAWYLTPGLYGQDFVGDYAIAETLGIDGQFDLGFPSFGLHQITVSTFMDDTTFLSESLFHDRGRLAYDDGGPGNTRGLHSFGITYDATNLPIAKNVEANYQLSFVSLGAGKGTEADEHRFAASFDVNIPLNGGTIAQTLQGRFEELRLFAEGVHFDSADGFNGHGRNYLTGATEFVHGPWVVDLTATERWSNGPGLHDYDSLQSVALGYALPSDTTVAIGMARERAAGESGVYFGISLSQTLTICDRCLIRGRHY